MAPALSPATVVVTIETIVGVRAKPTMHPRKTAIMDPMLIFLSDNVCQVLFSIGI